MFMVNADMSHVPVKISQRGYCPTLTKIHHDLCSLNTSVNIGDAHYQHSNFRLFPYICHMLYHFNLITF